MRHTYELTDETRKVLAGNVIRTAEEMNVSDKFVYGILSGDKTDPFAPFEHLYAASVRAGNPVCIYRSKLDAIDARYENKVPLKTEVECLTDKINANAESSAQTVEALKDGVIDGAEAERLLRAIDKERAILDLLEVRLQFKRDLRIAGARRK